MRYYRQYELKTKDLGLSLFEVVSNTNIKLLLP